jgi:hypothetical protein
VPGSAPHGVATGLSAMTATLPEVAGAQCLAGHAAREEVSRDGDVPTGSLRPCPTIGRAAHRGVCAGTGHETGRLTAALEGSGCNARTGRRYAIRAIGPGGGSSPKARGRGHNDAEHTTIAYRPVADFWSLS